MFAPPKPPREPSFRLFLSRAPAFRGYSFGLPQQLFFSFCYPSAFNFFALPSYSAGKHGRFFRSCEQRFFAHKLLFIDKQKTPHPQLQNGLTLRILPIITSEKTVAFLELFLYFHALLK